MVNRTILIADDERDLVETLALLCEMHGYAVVKAYDGYRAWRLARTRLPQVVVTDIGMPRMNGLELCGRLRVHPRTKHIPILVSSAASMPEGTAVFHDLLIPKPADVSALLQGIEQLVGRDPMVLEEAAGSVKTLW